MYKTYKIYEAVVSSCGYCPLKRGCRYMSRNGRIPEECPLADCDKHGNKTYVKLKKIALEYDMEIIANGKDMM